MIRVPVPVIISVQGDQLYMAEIISSSPIKLGSGGRARFARFMINHQVAVSGRSSCIPRASTMVRLWVRSYVVLARQNRADDTRPWAIIKIIAPVKPHGVWIKIPPATNPMWLTDE